MDEEAPTNKYDKEFVGLIREAEARIEKLDKGKKIKLNSWLRCLIVPSKKTEWKRNRNLYLISLIDNLINNRLDEPFNAFAPDNAKELKTLSPEIIKSQLSNRFFKEIDINKIEQGEPSYKNQRSQKNNSLYNGNMAEKSAFTSNQTSSPLSNYNYKDSMDKFKLESIIQVLQQKIAVKDEMIDTQLKEIYELKSKVALLKKKAQVIFSYQLQKQSSA